MNETKPASPVLEVARQDNTAYIRMRGMASFNTGPALKQFGTAAIKEGFNRGISGFCLPMESLRR